MNMDSPPSIQYCETLFLGAYDIQKQVQDPIHATVDVASSFCFVEAQYAERFAKRSVSPRGHRQNGCELLTDRGALR